MMIRSRLLSFRSPSHLRSTLGQIRHKSIKSKNKKETPRVNAVGIQYLSDQLQSKVFPNSVNVKEDPALLEISKQHLKDNELLGKPTQISDPIQIKNFPDLVGETGSLNEHFYKLGMKQVEPYLSMTESFLSPKTILPNKPKKWEFKAGWTRYEPGKAPESVPYPFEDELVFDVEVLYKNSPYAVLNTAVSKKAWYGWVSPFLIEYSKDPSYNDYEHLIPFNCLDHPKVLIGYNVGYDRARVFDEYNIKQSKAFYLDGMALHVATTGICSRQRIQWMDYKKREKAVENDEEGDSANTESDLFDLAQQLQDNPWLNKSSPNSLKIVAKHHCGIELDKADRDFFSGTDPNKIVENFDKLMTYCSTDVEATFAVTAKLFPEFRAKVPHPVSFAALRHLGSLILPSTKKWDGYIETAEAIFMKHKASISEKLNELVEGLMKGKKGKIEQDDWLSQLNWEIKEPKFKKDGEPYKRQAYLTGYPQWYRDLHKSENSESSLTLKSRNTPLFLRLKWEGYPLFWTNSCGWCFKVKYSEEAISALEKKNYVRFDPRRKFEDEEEMEDSDSSKSKPSKEDVDIQAVEDLFESGYILFKIPHPNGPSNRCTNVLGKNFSSYFTNGILSSEIDFAKEILKINSESSYWLGNRQRIKDQFIVYDDKNGKKVDFFNGSKEDALANPDMGIILPKICSMGTVTRRAVENTWLTASNSKKSRIGSELKAMIEAPKGYSFVGADVDSEELWIASLVGDSVFKFHGATALGWMTLEGTKNAGTDLHSKTADILGILRNDAKIFNYGRIYGAGVKFATRLLMQFNGKLNESQAFEIATKLYSKTKGVARSSKLLKGKIYHGGSESVMFNQLETIANEASPRTPVLGAAITAALTKKNLNSQQFLPSRVNWTIQSSGVDYLHLLIISMDYLSEKFNIPLRLTITVHDELRYLCKNEHKYQVALLLQISNLWTRAMFCQQVGINEVPQSCAFFSEVDVDHILRKDVNMDCVTPSQPHAIPPGESLDILSLLAKCQNGDILKENKDFKYDFSAIPFEEEPKVLDLLEKRYPEDKFENWLTLQCAFTSKQFQQTLKSFNSSGAVVEPIKPTKASKKLKKSTAAAPLKPGNTKTKKNVLQEFSKLLTKEERKLEVQFDAFDNEIVEDGDKLLEQMLLGYEFALNAKRRSAIPTSDKMITPSKIYSGGHMSNQRRFMLKSYSNKK